MAHFFARSEVLKGEFPVASIPDLKHLTANQAYWGNATDWVKWFSQENHIGERFFLCLIFIFLKLRSINCQERGPYLYPRQEVGDCARADHSQTQNQADCRGS